MPPKKYKIGTWNLNSIKVRLPHLLHFLEEHSPDVLCLQELKCEEDAFPFKEIEKRGYHSSVFGQKTYNGVAILSKTPLQNIAKGMGDENEDPSARLIGGLYDNQFQVYSAYFPNGQEVGSDKYLYKLNWFKRLKTYFETNPQGLDSVLLCGDFNVAPEDRDVYDPTSWRGKILCSDRERRALKELMALGFSDVFRIHETEGGHYTWWDYRELGFAKNHGLRIDLILAGQTLSSACKSTVAYRNERKGEKPSDHIPVIAEFSF